MEADERPDVTQFVLENLRGVGNRILEVGCGAGTLARAILAAGHDIVAIDPRAPAGPRFRRDTLASFEDPAAFHAVVAVQSLHHIDDLPAAIEKIRGLLVPGGRLIVDEQAWDRMDRATATWLLSRIGRQWPDAPRAPESFLAWWETEHAGIHRWSALREALAAGFRQRHFAWTPHLYHAIDVADQSRADEADLISCGAISATAFQYVGERA